MHELEDRKKEVRRWIDGLNLQNVSGRLIDLREPAKSVPFSRNQFRKMVFYAAERLMKTRGATVLLPENPEQHQAADYASTAAPDNPGR